MSSNSRLERRCLKTRMCKYALTGVCRQGGTCPFAHNERELQHAPDLTRTKMCPMVSRGDVCRNPRCSYAHKRSELRKVVLGSNPNAAPAPPPPSRRSQQRLARQQLPKEEPLVLPLTAVPPPPPHHVALKTKNFDSPRSADSCSTASPASWSDDSDSEPPRSSDDALGRRPASFRGLAGGDGTEEPAIAIKMLVVNTFVHVEPEDDIIFDGPDSFCSPPRSRRARSVPRSFAPTAVSQRQSLRLLTVRAPVQPRPLVAPR